MRILLTGTTGYIGQRLLPVLLEKGHEVVCCVRDKKRFDTSKYNTSKLTVIEVDFLKEETLENIPENIDAAYWGYYGEAQGDNPAWYEWVAPLYDPIGEPMDLAFEITTPVVPIPSAVWLMGCGLLALVGMKRRSFHR